MRPWFIVTGDFTLTGGMDRANFALADRLARRGIPVHLVAHRVDEHLSRYGNVTIHHVPRPGGMHFPASFLLKRTATAIARRFPNAIIVGNGGNLLRPDLCWVHYLHGAWNGPAVGGPVRRVKSCVERHVERAREMRSLSESRAVICNSRQTADAVSTIAGIPTERIHVVHYGTDADRFAPVEPKEREQMRAELKIAPQQLCVAFIGALGDRRKNFDTLFAAWIRLAECEPWRDAVLLVVGQGAQLAFWRHRATEIEQAARFRFLGFRRDVPQVLAACDLLVHPARYEAFGLSPYEALCRGVPVIVSASAGIAEVLPDHLAGWSLHSPDDVDELTSRLQQWCGEREKRSETARSLSHQLRNRSWDDMADDIIQIGMTNKELMRDDGPSARRRTPGVPWRQDRARRRTPA